MTLIPLSEALDNMLLYVEDQKPEKESQDFERLETAVVQAAANSAFVAPKQLQEIGPTVCVGASHSRSARGLAHSIARFSSLACSIQALDVPLLPGILLLQRCRDRYQEPRG